MSAMVEKGKPLGSVVKNAEAVVSDKSVKAGLRELAVSLEGDVHYCQEQIRLATERDIIPKTKLGKIKRFFNGSTEDEIKRTGRREIVEKTNVIKAINAGDKSCSVKFLVRRISLFIGGIPTGLTDESIGGTRTHSAQEYNDILRKIDPNQAKKIQIKLDKGKIKPLNKS